VRFLDVVDFESKVVCLIYDKREVFIVKILG